MSHQNTDPEDQLLDRLIALIDDHVYAEGTKHDRWVEGIDEAAAAIIDEFDVREHDDEDTATITIEADTERFTSALKFGTEWLRKHPQFDARKQAESSLPDLIAKANEVFHGPKGGA